MRNICKMVLLIIGTIIGAGFASGKEIYIFFFQYGIYGILGIALSTGIIGAIIYQCLKKNDIDYSINEKISLQNITNKIVNIFLLVSYFIMIAGFAAFLNQEFNLPIIWGSSIIVVLCYITFLNNINGIIKMSNLLVPVLVILIIHISLKNVNLVSENMINMCITCKYNNWILSSIIYASYNSIMLIPIIKSVRNNKYKKIENVNISIISSIIIFILALGIFGLLLNGDNNIWNLEMPLVAIASLYGKMYRYMYCIIIAASIFTSAISAGYSFLISTSNNSKSYKRNLIIISIIAIMVSKLGFSWLVNLLYPVLGVIGIVQIVLLFKI